MLCLVEVLEYEFDFGDVNEALDLFGELGTVEALFEIEQGLVILGLLELNNGLKDLDVVFGVLILDEELECLLTVGDLLEFELADEEFVHESGFLLAVG